MKSTLDSIPLAASVGEREENGIDVSVVIPVTERPEPLPSLFDEYAGPLRSAGYTIEFIYVGGPWSAQARDSLGPLAERGEPVRVLEVGQPVGEASLVRMAGAHCRGRIVVTLPAYHRVQATSLPELVERVERGADLAVARRWPRHDSAINRVQNRALHRLLGGLTGNRIHDVACGVRAMRRELLQELPVYGDFLRFLPVLAMREGYRVEEVDAPQHPKDVGARVYRPGVYLRRLLDVLGLFFLLRFKEKPLRFFGMVGSVFSIVGGIVLAIGVVQRIIGQEGLADRPLLLFGVLFVVLGAQAIALGLIGEIIVHLQARRNPTYRVRVPGDRS